VFLVPMKIAALSSFLVMLPYTLYQAWAFVAPGLYLHEKKFVMPLVVSSTMLFFAGMAFAYFLIFPMVFKFMASFAPQGVAWMTDIEKYFGFALSMFVVFGITFETPVVVVLLVKMGLVSVEKLKEIRPYVFVGAFIVGAVFTPPDVLSQFALAIPLYILYEAGILCAQMLVTAKPAEVEPG
jgi:sec-independent protein translocase protein TatC